MLDVMAREQLPYWRRLLGIATFEELLGRGYPRGRIRTLVQQGELIQVSRGVYAWAGRAEPIGQLPGGALALRAAAVLAVYGPAAVVSHHTAAQLHQIEMLDRPSMAVAITRPPGTGTRSARQGVQLHVARLPGTHVGNRFGLPVTTAARTVSDLARGLDFRAGVVVADSALRQRLTSQTELGAVLADCAQMPGTLAARQVLEFADPRAESVLESVSRVAFRDHGLPAPDLQVNLNRGAAFIGRVDFYWEKYKVIAEADGALKYDTREAAVDQLRRDQRLRDAGYEVIHFTWQEITQTPELVVRRILVAFGRSQRRETRRGGG